MSVGDQTRHHLNCRSRAVSAEMPDARRGGRTFRRSVLSGLRVPVRKTGLELDSRDRGRTVFLDGTHDE